MSTSEPRISDERASASAGLTSLGWLKALRHDLPGSTIPTRTHESGRAVRACLDGKKMWPNVTMTPANKLVSRYFKKYDPFQREYRYATLREAFEYLQPHLPKDVPYLGPVCKPSSEAGVGLAANFVTYGTLFKVAQSLLLKDTDMVLELHAGLTSQHEANAGRPVIADEALVLMHRDCVQVSEQSEWLAGSELRLKSLSAKERRLFKCVMLMEEFKLLNANMTPDSGRNDKETTTTIEEWSLIRNTAKEARIQKQMRKQKGRGQTSEEVICLMPGGEKAPTIFAQALVYSKRFRSESFIVDDWSCPKSIRFTFEPEVARNMPTSNRPKELPVAAELSHLAIAGVKNKLAVTPQEAALFLLAEQMGLTECTWLEQKIPRAKDRRAIQGEETLPPADSAGVKPLSNLKFIKRKAADVNGGQLDETSRVLKSPRHA